MMTSDKYQDKEFKEFLAKFDQQMKHFFNKARRAQRLLSEIQKEAKGKQRR